METYVKFRYTLSEYECENLLEFEDKFKCDYLDKFDSIICSIGYEIANNLNQPTHPHIHIHFSTLKKVDTIRKSLTRMWSDRGEVRKRASLYCLKTEDDVKEMDFFLRYPLKQRSDFLRKYCRLPPAFNFDFQQNCAYESWLEVVAVNNKKLETQLAKESTFDKMCTWLELPENKPNSKRETLVKVFEYYKNEKLAMNIATMTGYSLTYCVINSFVPNEEVISLMENKFMK